MDSLIGNVMAMARKDEWDQVVSLLDKNQETIIKNASQLNGAIDALADDITRNAIAVIWLGAIRAALGEEAPERGTIPLTERLIAEAPYKEQMRDRTKVMDKWRVLIHRYAEHCRNMKMFRRGIKFVGAAVSKFQPTPNHLTPAHSDFLMLAMKGCIPTVALPLLATPIFDIEPRSTGSNATDYLLYYYYAGLVFVSQRQWSQCLRMLECAMSIVAYGTSAIMVEAYKLYLLVGVIAKGKFLPIPKRASGAMERVGKQLTSEYMDFASACESRDQSRINKMLQDFGAVFERDRLMTLVEEAQISVVKHTIRGMTKVYVTLNIADMASEVQLPVDKVREMLLEMIADGAITAKIDSVTGMVSFTDDDAAHDAVDVEEAIARANSIIERINKVEDAVALSVPFVAEKLRSMPNYRELLQEFEAARRKQRGVAGVVAGMFNMGGGSANAPRGQ